MKCKTLKQFKILRQFEHMKRSDPMFFECQLLIAKDKKEEAELKKQEWLKEVALIKQQIQKPD